MSERTPQGIADEFTLERTQRHGADGKGVKFAFSVRAYADGVVWIQDELASGGGPEPWSVARATAFFTALCERAITEAKGKDD